MMIKRKGKTIFSSVEISDTYAKKIKGLSGRKEMKGGGLLLVFSYEAKHGIWMPGMKFPIDIVFIDGNKKVADIVHDAKPISLNPKTWKVFRPKRKAKYVLEIPAGMAREKRLKEGDIVQFDIGNSN